MCILTQLFSHVIIKTKMLSTGSVLHYHSAAEVGVVYMLEYIHTDTHPT